MVSDPRDPGIDLRRLCVTVRQDIVTMIHNAGSGHPGGSLSAVEILVELFFRQLRLDPSKPGWPERDVFILSKGHACPVLYSVMARRGYFPVRELGTLRKMGSRLQGHPDAAKLPGLEVSAGSLGHGLSIACGFALGIRLLEARAPEGRPAGEGRRVFCLLGDGELQEGSVWEAAMTAAHGRVSNLVAVVDRNMVQLDGPTEQVMALEPLESKWAAFGWHVVPVDGHDLDALHGAFEECRSWSLSASGPSVVIARTVKGKGVSFMEGRSAWHGKCPDDESYGRAMSELESGED